MNIIIQRKIKPETDNFGPKGRIEYHLLDKRDNRLIDIELSYIKACESALQYEPLIRK